MMSVEWILLYLMLGAFVGFMAGLLGVGGGGILVPLLVTIFSYQNIGQENIVHLALGTSLACMMISSSSSAYAHKIKGNVVWKMVFGMVPGITIGTLMVTHIAADINATYIALFFAAFMALVAVQMFMNWKPKPSSRPTKLQSLIMAGAGIGSISALAAVGGGFLAVTYFTFKNIEMKKAVGNSAAIGLPIAITGTMGYLISGWSKTLNDPYTYGFIYLPAFIVISIASFITAPLGASYSTNLPDKKLKRIFAIVSLLLSLKMLYSVFQH